MNPLESDMKSNIKINQNVKSFGGYPLHFLIPYGEDTFQDAVQEW